MSLYTLNPFEPNVLLISSQADRCWRDILKEAGVLEQLDKVWVLRRGCWVLDGWANHCPLLALIGGRSRCIRGVQQVEQARSHNAGSLNIYSVVSF